MARTTQAAETDTRLRILNSLLTTPHRRMEEIWPFHEELVKSDPLFYARLGVWYSENGEIRDHQEAFCAALSLSSFSGHRDVGLALLRELEPYRIGRVVDWVHGRYVSPHRAGHATTGDKKPKAKAAATTETKEKPAKVKFGLFKNLPRAMITEVTRYIREREAEDEWFDSVAMANRKTMKRLYGLLHIKPSERAQQILFLDNPPKDSKAYVIKQLVNAKTPAEQAKAIIDNKISYRVATSAITAMTPTVLLALIGQMSPQDVLNNLASLQRRGALTNPELKALVDQKLEEAKTYKRTATMKGKEAAKIAGLDEATQKKIAEVMDTQVKVKGQIKRPTAIIFDKSGSMQEAIFLAKEIAAMVSAATEADLFVYAFDTMAYPIYSEGKDLASWDKALAGINANGGTSCGVALKYLMREKQYIENLVIITDQGENQPPYFIPTLQEYKAAMKVDPTVVLVKTQNSSNHLETQAHAAGQAMDTWQFSGDKYALPGLLKFLTAKSKLDMLMEIMSWPLPKRKVA